MRLYGFTNVAVRATKADVKQWRSEAKSAGMKLGDYLRKKIDDSSVVNHVRLNEQTQGLTEQRLSITPDDAGDQRQVGAA